MQNLQDHNTEQTTRKPLPLLTIGAVTIMVLAMLGVNMNASAQSSAEQSGFEALQKDTQELMDSIGNFTAQQRDEAVMQAKQSLAALDARIERMQARFDANMEVMSIEAQQMTRDALDELREQRATVDEQLEQMASNTADAWGNVKNGFVSAYEKMYEAWEKAEMNLTESS